MATTYHITTAEELLRSPNIGRCELVRGEIVMMTPAGFEHGRIAAFLCFRLVQFLEEQPLGVIAGAETGFLIARAPDTVRAPDVGFISRERVPSGPTRGFFHGAPDLAVEVLSPNDLASEVTAKVREWLGAGCRAVWVVDPVTQTVSVYRSPNRMVVLSTSDELSGDDVLPGFTLQIAEIFLHAA